MTNINTSHFTGASEAAGNLAFDTNSLNSLKQAAKEQSPEAIKGVAKQFEAIFMNMMLKSMREATPQDGIFDNDQSRTFTSMLDQQLTSNLSSKGLGLADVLARQLTKGGYGVNSTLEQAVSDPLSSSDKLPKEDHSLSGNQFLNQASLLLQPQTSQKKSVDAPAESIASSSTSSISNFQQRMSQHAQAASQATGIPAHLMLGQAALESGWGKRELNGVDGTPSNNLFGIKATGNWNGKVVEAMTTEYINGVKQKRIEKFRAYDSYADSFKDFANLIRNNPRYNNVIANLDDANNYAQAMQKSGYATDPNYAIKLANVIQKVSPS